MFMSDRPSLDRVAELHAAYGEKLQKAPEPIVQHPLDDVPMAPPSPPAAAHAQTPPPAHVPNPPAPKHAVSPPAKEHSAEESHRTLAPGDVLIDQLSADQEQALAEARRIYVEAGGVLDELERPFLIRFLVFFKWRAKKAQKMLLATAAWRASSGANAIRRRILSAEGFKFVDFPYARKHLQLLWALPLHGLTSSGDIMSFMHVGSMADHMSTWYADVTDGEFFEYNLHVLEMYLVQADRESVRCGVLRRSSVVFDCMGTKLSQVSTKLVSRLKPALPLPDLYYPELVGATFALNAPWAVHTLWGLIKVFLSKEIQAKVVILSPKETETSFMSHVRPEDVPKFVTSSALCSTMPLDVAMATGFAGLEDAELDSLLVNRTAAGYKVPNYTAEAMQA